MKFEKNLYEKAKIDDFKNDMLNLLASGHEWQFEHAYQLVMEKFMTHKKHAFFYYFKKWLQIGNHFPMKTLNYYNCYAFFIGA